MASRHLALAHDNPKRRFGSPDADDAPVPKVSTQHAAAGCSRRITVAEGRYFAVSVAMHADGLLSTLKRAMLLTELT
jgi:hypothetical protein